MTNIRNVCSCYKRMCMFRAHAEKSVESAKSKMDHDANELDNYSGRSNQNNRRLIMELKSLTM